MELMTYSDFENLLSGPMGPYYVGRWEYFKVVIDIISRLNPQSVLELGPGQHTIVKLCDVMLKLEDDAWGRPINPTGKVILHNATEKPWPIVDKQYDLFIALQVWEHLDNKQSRAFREAMRVSRAAILSLPYLWDVPPESRNYPAHHQIDEELIEDWTLHVPPEEVIRIPRSGPEVSKGPRIIYFWKFL